MELGHLEPIASFFASVQSTTLSNRNHSRPLMRGIPNTMDDGRSSTQCSIQTSPHCNPQRQQRLLNGSLFDAPAALSTFGQAFFESSRPLVNAGPWTSTCLPWVQQPTWNHCWIQLVDHGAARSPSLRAPQRPWYGATPAAPSSGAQRRIQP